MLVTFNAAPKRYAGMTLIELMVALAIGSFLMIGAVTVFMQSRTTFRITESVSRLQENARFALDAIEPDIRMASYYGLTSRGFMIENAAGALEPPLAIAPGLCGPNWTVDFDNPVAGTNNGYVWACAGNSPNLNSDTLVVRRVREDVVAPAALLANRLYVQSFRGTPGLIFQGPGTPPGFDPDFITEFHELTVSGYYVSAPAGAVPMLRRWTLRGLALIDEEVLPGVEDLQIQFGVDTDLPGTDDRGAVNLYVNANDPILTPGNPAFNDDFEILAVRIWLRVRAERAENGFTDTTNYVYADQNVAAPGDGFRRVVVSKTIYLRNARRT